MEEKLLAIIIIGRNEESNLPEVFDSVKKASKNLNTEFGELPEILYIDSRSTDASIRIAHESGIQSYVVEGDLSPGISRNLGALKSTSKYIFFLDGDTVLTEDFLVHGIHYLEKHHKAAGVGGILDFRIFRGTHMIVQFDNYRNTQRDGEKIYDGVGGTFLFKREDFISAGKFSPNLLAGEEFDLLLRIINNGKILVRICHRMAIHNDQKSTEVSFLRRYLFTKRIYLSGIITRQAPKSRETLNVILRRFWLHILSLPLLMMIIFLPILKLWLLSLGLVLALLLLNFIYKGFDLKRSVISFFSMIIFSFGWWTGLFIRSKHHLDS